jgi:D-alanine-D-alanine ligase
MARVLLLFGGRSAEHEVSCVSSVAIAAALGDAGHDVVAVGIGPDGSWHLARADTNPLQASGPEVEFVVPGGIVRGPAGPIQFDVAFPVLHGPFGEDGTIQGMFEMAGVPYVGCGVLASAVAMDKDIAKRLFIRAGIPTMGFEAVWGDRFADDPGGTVSRIVEHLGLPVFVKPAELGSSVGVTKATTEAELKGGILVALEHGAKAIVEEAIVGREIEVAVLEGRGASLPGEVMVGGEFYDYHEKYEDGSSDFVAPATLSEAQTAAVRALAERAFEAIEGRGLARVDFLFEDPGRGFLINEVNTMPGFTPISGFPKMWEATGLGYSALCDALVRTALPSD